MKGFQVLKNGLLTRLVFSILICLVLTSCLEVKQKINIKKDGSGSTKLEIAIQKELLFDPQAIPKVKNELQKEGWIILGEGEKEGKHIITLGRKFKNISELTDDEARYEFNSERKGFLKKSYALEIKHLKSSEIPFPYEVSIEMPGDIDGTNGTKVSSDEIKWNLQGFRRGTKLSGKSSGFSIPGFVSVVIVMVGVLLLFVGGCDSKQNNQASNPPQKSCFKRYLLYAMRKGKPSHCLFLHKLRAKAKVRGVLYDL